ncbi:MAG: DUF445 family protein [Gemmatimonadetes bacterium]|uniref:DUF445 family protein n=1 Tax=Candidatus Kutchimonas denitrificans TaxID=3056748 RepID=A0AAE4Z9G0_9BACT|nr:DUF445 family protein [Gemmatimonadota bacterium]NIR75493.1 DUF445 family protein [Candidatus Kutchimonas denitrificans]NIS01807.1 DUF445 family protein [Gemmatimonadota bacterium]NIT67588.1 DUF445 family protein [Gemmatimonadota bacterium]NIU53462.1 DUF445 family protein [Gemmatimonadota bacterium]
MPDYLRQLIQIDYVSFVVIGTIAGLLTNAVAIWMLFHPHEALRAGRLRLFPQGAIPKEIGRIARRIGQTVGTHLLRTEDIVATLGQPEFRERFDSTLRNALERLLDKELGNLRSELPEHRLGEVAGTVSEFGERLLEGLVEYLNGAAFERRVHELVERLRSEFGEVPLEQVLTPAAREQLVLTLRDLGEGVVMGHGFRQTIGDFFHRNLREFVNSDEPLGRFVPVGAINFGEAVVGNYLPLVLDRFGQVLESPAAQERVRRALRDFIDGYLSQQGMFQQIVGRLIITERTLSQTVQALERGGAEEVAALLREPLIQDRAAAAVNDAIDDMLQRPVREIFGDMSDEELARVGDVLADRIVDFARHETTEEFVVNRTDRLLKASEGKRLVDVLEYLGPEAAGRITNRLADWVVEIARGERVHDLLEATLVRQTEWLMTVPIGRLRDYLPPDAIDRADQLVFGPLWEFLQKRVPALVAELPIAEMVEQRIRAYPIADFERLIWTVTRRELRLIIYLGGFLGAVVGSLMVVLQAPAVGATYVGVMLLASYLFINLR